MKEKNNNTDKKIKEAEHIHVKTFLEKRKSVRISTEDVGVSDKNEINNVK